LPLKDAVEEAQRIVKEADSRKVTMRLLGGIAFRLTCPSALHQALRRNYVDIDFMGLRKQKGDISKLFVGLGYSPRAMFNAMNGDIRLIFNDLENERRVDIFLNVFEMCHKFDFSDRLKLHDLTLPLADLLLTKLQVYEITEREYRDVIAMLKDHEFSNSDKGETINLDRITKLCADDWGIYKTVTLNLERISGALPNYLPDSVDRDAVSKKTETIRKKIEDEGKSFRWKMRARVGEKVKWYELPEADKEVVDSRSVEDRAPAAAGTAPGS